ncbi:hypothetical protein EJ994_14710 [Maribacter sp. MJ134]|uniref:tetratricopeptide repeat-containing sensor histidine kinase n=1 Tax=Maribacter sp. MJ134 TaxID=2496865 RepID=UPI000F821A7C|nr:ATP-binding protein [Maribacter sp. MJ134]AZQ59988.1 hypothetical protein EJ994_14710 [Maribacter sp. MJ134]
MRNQLIFLYGILFLSGLSIFAQEEDSLLMDIKLLNESGQYRQTLRLHLNRNTQNADYYILIGKAFEGLNQEDSAFHYYKLAKNNFQKNNKFREVALLNLEIASVLESQNNLKENTQYFDEFWDYAIETNDTNLLAQGYNYKGRVSFLNEDAFVPKNYFEKAFELFKNNGNSKMAINNLMNIGVVYSNRLKKNDSARVYYFKAIELLKKDGQHLQNTNQFHDLLNNIGNSYRRDKNYSKALEFYKQAETLQVKKYHAKTKKILFSNMDATYYHLGDFEKAYDYLYKYDSIKDVINLVNQNTTISDIQEKYDNEKLRADNLVIEKKRIQNRNWLIAASLALLFGAGIAILLQKNTTKKRQLAEQEALLKQERVDNLLKEQELVSIDAMIEGQEKERQRVANELHDDLGSLMATIKLHFDNSKTSKKDPSLQNAEKLLEEAYQKVRGMAHSKNSGVMSSQGLLPTIKKMAQVITETNALQVTVEDFGMGERLENSLELNLFRMVQELVANVIKHADASTVSIQLTQHEDNLNIIIEDNGKGFDRSKIDTGKTGMGLTTIEKRVEHLEGNFTVDSILGKGTSILIDIPV